MKIGAIIFSRMSSSRLPGKALLDIYGKSLLDRVLERVKSIKKINHICIATSKNKEDDKIEYFAKSRKIEIFRGSLNDVSSRALSAANHFKYDSFLRVCGDRPFLDPNIYDQLIETHKLNSNDLTTNIFPRMVPPGLTGEVIKVEALSKSILRSDNSIDREHVTRFFYKNPHFFKIQNIRSLKNSHLTDLRLVIDNEQDFERAVWILKKINEKGCNEFSTKKVISYAKEWELKNKLIKN